MSNVFHVRRHRRPLGLVEIGVIVSAVVAVGVIASPLADRAIADAALTSSSSASSREATTPSPSAIIGAADVRDGDSLHIGRESIRLQGVDAFELHQTCGTGACGREAKAALESLTAGKTVSCEPVDTDRYGRTVALCSAGGVDLNGALVRQGHALAYRQYSTAYVAEENAARMERIGAWAGTFENPADWRREHPRRR